MNSQNKWHTIVTLKSHLINESTNVSNNIEDSYKNIDQMHRVRSQYLLILHNMENYHTHDYKEDDYNDDEEEQE